MLLLEIFFALWWIWLPLLVALIIIRNDKKKGPRLPARNQAQDLEWNNYIASFLPAVKSKAEKHLINALLERKTPQQLYAKSVSQTSPEPLNAREITEKPDQAAQQPAPALAVTSPTVTARPTPQPIDGTVLLLYFGAFLLIASAGLFAALDDFSGTLRTLALAVTAGLFYIAGLWIYGNKPKLKQAGVSFMGVGMVMAPLIGVAWYNLIADQSSGALIWLLTSILCLGLYVHAYSAVNNEFIAYLLIGSFVSSVESTVLAASLPTYVFAWVAIAAGLGLQCFGLWRGQSKQLLSASDTSAQLLIPLSILSSLVLLPKFGSIQLAVSLLLAGGYYGLLAWQRVSDRSAYSAAAQFAILAAIGNFAYAVDTSIHHVAGTLAAIAVFYTILIIVVQRDRIYSYGCLPVAAVASIGSMLFALDAPWLLTISMGITVALSGVVWLKYQNSESLMISGLLVLALPLVIGQYALDPQLTGNQQLLAYIPTMLALFAVTIFSQKLARLSASFDTASSLYILEATTCLVIGWLTGLSALTFVCALLAISYMLLWRVGRQPDWLVVASLVMVIPIAYALLTYGIDNRAFSMAVALGLAINALLSLFTRLSAVRWVLVGTILLAPLALGGGGLGFTWQESGFAGGYLLAMASCVLARAIARGKLLRSYNVTLSSYEKGASTAFVAGYIGAAVLSVIISLYDSNSQLVTTAILGVLTLSVVLIARTIENYDDGLVLIPLLAQGMLFSGIRPNPEDATALGVTALLSTVLAVCMYASLNILIRTSSARKSLLVATIATGYTGSSLILLEPNDTVWFPLSLILAGCMTFYHNRRAAQDTKEISLFIVIAGLHWLLYVLGVENIHIHTHLLALELAGFAYWRFSRGEQGTGNNYVAALYLVATVPLVLQALGDASGATYGLLLISQQVAFMVIGSMLQLRFLLQAGLWVAAASVLYQLRGLGWAFLGIVAIILIGIAMYRLQKHDD